MKKINAFVYRDKEELFVVPLATEKKTEIHNDLYDSCDGGNPLKEESIALCWHEDNKSDLAVIVDLYLHKKLVKANRIKFDDLVGCAYDAAIKYTKVKKISKKNSK
jgi:hypothetical protein